MKIPKKLNVCGIPYKVEEQHPVLIAEGQTVWGHIDFGRCLIRLDRDLNPDKKVAVLMHEIIHAIDEATGIGIGEEDTDRLANALVDTLRRNKLDFNG